MNTDISKTLKDLERISKRMENVLSFKNDKEKFKFEESMLNSDVMHLIRHLMDTYPERKMANKDLAKKLGVSTSYVSQLFSGDKKFNRKLLINFQRIFDVRFQFTTKDGVGLPDEQRVVLNIKYNCNATNESQYKVVDKLAPCLNLENLD